MAAAQQARLRPDDRLDLRADPGDRADLRRRGNGPVLLAVVLLLLVAAGLGGYLWWADWSPTGATPHATSPLTPADDRPALPAESEVIVVGGGTAGAAVAARLVEGGREVLVLEAGPDPGPLGSPDWPADLVDATRLGHSNDWGFDSGDTYREPIRFERSRIIGGCSAHNGAVQTWGHRLDYDGWAEYAGPGWETDELLPYFHRATEQLHIPAADVIGVGINGAGEAFAEFQKKEPTGFFGTIAVSSTNHGKDSAANLVDWIKTGKQPPADTQTTGKLMVRSNWQEVRKELGI